MASANPFDAPLKSPPKAGDGQAPAASANPFDAPLTTTPASAVPGSPAAPKSDNPFDAPLKPQPPPDPDQARRDRLKAIAYQAMTGGQPDSNLAAHANIALNNYSWGATGPVSAAIRAMGTPEDTSPTSFAAARNQGKPQFPPGTSFADRYSANEAAYDQRLAEDRASTGNAGDTTAGLANFASMFGPAEAAGLWKLGEGGAALAAKTGRPVIKWLGEHILQPAINVGTASAVQGGLEGRGSVEDRLSNAYHQGIHGAETGAVLGPTVGAAASRLATPAEAAATAPAGQDLAASIDRLEGGSTAWDANQAAGLANNLKTRLGHVNIPTDRVPLLDPLFNSKAPLLPSELAALRDKASALTKGSDATQQQIGHTILGGIDDFQGNVNPAITSLGPDELNSAMSNFRHGWGKNAIATDITGTPAEIRQRAQAFQTRMTRAPDEPPAWNPAAERMDQLQKVAQPTFLQRASDYLVNHPYANKVIWGAGPSATGALTASGTPFPVASSIGSGITGGLLTAKAAINRGLNAAPGQALDELIQGYSPAEKALLQGPPTRESLAALQQRGLIRNAAASQLPAAVYTGTVGGGGGGGSGW